MNSITKPKVFLSHASEDKIRFVNDFAQKLSYKGVNVWFDKLEMLPGDSLIDKIFDEGLKNADVVLIVISKNSISKPWVKEELNSSIIKKIEKGTLVIPIIIDKCVIPESLKTTVCETIKDIDNYDNSFNRILASIFGKSLKPPIGTPPEHFSKTLDDINGLEHTDNLVLKASCEYLLENTDCIINPYRLFGEGKPNSIPKSEVLESIEILDDAEYIKADSFLGIPSGNWGCDYRVTTYGFQEYCKVHIKNHSELIDQCAGLIVNDDKANNNHFIQNELDIPLMLVNHIIRMFENNELLKTSNSSGHINIYSVSAKMRRVLK